MLAYFPGIFVALALTGAAVFVSDHIGHDLMHVTGASPISPITVAIVLGIIAGNLFGVPKKLASGLDVCVKKLLRLGIILIGLKLSLGDVAKDAALILPVVALVIAGGLAITAAFARYVGVSSGLGLVTAAATSICGVTAAVSVAPVVEATEEELSYAVANVTLYGLIGMLFYPYLAHWVFPTQPQSAGLFLGTAIHDTSQVMGAALSYQQVFHDDAAFKFATITKLTRNVFLVVVVPLLAYLHARRGGKHTETKLSTLFPTFVLGFLAMVAVRTAGDHLWPSPTWSHGIKLLTDTVATWLLGAALAAVGLTTQLSRLRGLGLKPLYVGGAAATCVGLLGMGLAAIAAHFN